MNNRFTILHYVFLFLFFSCSESSEEETVREDNYLREFRFEVVDSVLVDALEVLVALDYDQESDRFLLKKLSEGKVYVVDSKGEILQTVDLGGEGPNQVGAFTEGQFLGASGYIFKEFSPTMDFHQYDFDFQKVKVHTGAAVGINALVINFYKQTFDALTINGEPYLLGEEINAYDAGKISGNKIGAAFYERANTGFLLNLNQDSIQRINLFTEDWRPRQEKIWVGNSLPNIASDPKTQSAFVLPTKGNQLSFFKVSPSGLEFQNSIELIHPAREDAEINADQDDLTYPGFDNVRNLGEYQLVSFNTAIPEDVLNGIKAKAGENYYSDPEFKEALELFRNSKYILIKDGKQVGVINEDPQEGTINLGLPDGTVLVKAADGEIERDYNLFYKMKVVEK
ncbi:hypothetical protein JYB62_17245 [Algoriphagus lutimaris]|uniref:hypothetical protein n=1 Tax=Algoriphagus lutimaris TaxID=613197 RepID=UPI00196B972D|nr:hypothetical protein [Algoriphagus lutimaris]MBN3521758.1 hypothetical protein [Algoriphagus lutimaris]